MTEINSIKLDPKKVKAREEALRKRGSMTSEQIFLEIMKRRREKVALFWRNFVRAGK